MAIVSIPHSWNQSARRWRSSVKVPNVRTGSEARSGPTAATCIFAPTSMAAARGWMGDIAREWIGLFFPVMPASPCVANSGRGWTAQDINFLTGITARRHHSQVRNNPWTTFFYGIIRHQKFVGRSPPPSDPTAGPFLWPQAGRRPARVFLVRLVSVVERTARRCRVKLHPNASAFTSILMCAAFGRRRCDGGDLHAHRPGKHFLASS